MNPAVIFCAGAVLFIASLMAALWCSDHPGYATVEGGTPHWTTIASILLWGPMILGLLVMAGVYINMARYWP